VLPHGEFQHGSVVCRSGRCMGKPLSESTHSYKSERATMPLKPPSSWFQVAQALLAAAQGRNGAAWTTFQSSVHALKLRRSALERSITALRDPPAPPTKSPAAPVIPVRAPGDGRVRVVLITGFESFNQALYVRAAAAARRQFPGLELCVFSDRDILSKKQQLEAALEGADVFFGSLIFDFDQVSQANC
jgi:hypothetical protein